MRDFIAIHPAVVEIDVTGYIDDSYEHIGNINRVFEVYLCDTNQRTYLCELRPSYYLEFLYVSIEFADGTADDVINEIDSDLMDGDSTYVHCSRIDDPSTGVRVVRLEDVLVDCDPGEDREIRLREEMEDLVDYYCGNQCFF